MTGRALFVGMNRVHRLAQRVSGGRLGWTAMGMPMLELTTTGRRSGQPHAVLLAAPIHEDGAYVVVASAGGNDRPPAWLLNVQADRVVRVRRGRVAQPMHATVASTDERAAWWDQIVAAYPHYGRYQDKTEREIALVRLSPA
jgi:deazaflavin-dependent oxidoreductase (nitroreductase family)